MASRRRRRWRSWQAGLDPRRLIFLDETWIKISMAPLRGWGPKGDRLRGFAPHGRWRTMTFLGALRCDHLTAPCVFDGPINGECFRAYVEQQLVPILKPGDIVVMDNLGSHKSATLRRKIRAAGARPQVLTSELQQVEGIQHRLVDDPAQVQVFEDGDAVPAAHDGLSIQRERLGGQCERSVDDCGIAGGPVESAPG